MNQYTCLSLMNTIEGEPSSETRRYDLTRRKPERVVVCHQKFHKARTSECQILTRVNIWLKGERGELTSDSREDSCCIQRTALNQSLPKERSERTMAKLVCGSKALTYEPNVVTKDATGMM